MHVRRFAVLLSGLLMVGLVAGAGFAATGDVTEFPVPTANSAPQAVAAGPDGSLWFTEGRANKIGRTTTAGTTTEFPIPTPNGAPLGIAAGPDGNLWFTESTPNRIGRITTSGTITEFPVPAPASIPSGIATGPDGNLWVTLFSSHVARVTPSATFTEFPTPTPASGDFRITPAMDGNLWFTEEFADRIARLKAAAAKTAYVLSADAGFTPEMVKLKQGWTVKWVFRGPASHTATDSSGMGLFDSGSQSIVSYFSLAFAAAGTYPYVDALHPALIGQVRVPMLASPKTGDTSTKFTLTWASAPPPPGFVHDLQVKIPGMTRWSMWIGGTTDTSLLFTPQRGPGTYSFRARMRKREDDSHTGWSPSASIVVT